MLGVWPSLSGFRQTYFASVFSRSFFYAMPLLFVPKGRGFFLWKILDTNRTKIARLDKQKALQNKIFTVALIKILEMLITSMIKLLAWLS